MDFLHGISGQDLLPNNLLPNFLPFSHISDDDALRSLNPVKLNLNRRAAENVDVYTASVVCVRLISRRNNY